MIGGRRALTLALLVITMPALVLAERAWACVALPEVTVLPNSSAPAGHTFTVQGTNFAGPVEIRWNSAEGPLLARANNPTAATPVTVPSAAPGLYMVIMLSRLPDRTVGAIARAPFYVQGPKTAAATKPAPSKDETGLLLVAVIVGLAVLGVWGLVLLRRVAPRSAQVG